MIRTFTFMFFLLFLFQFSNAQKKTFLRVYTSGGKKISKGHFFDTSDTSIILKKGKKYIETHVTEIDLIKSKRTIAGRISFTAVKIVGFSVVIVVAIYSLSRGGNLNRRNANKTKGNEISASLKPLKIYTINRNLDTWREQRILLNQLW